MLEYSAVWACLLLASALPTACAQHTQVSAGGETQARISLSQHCCLFSILFCGTFSCLEETSIFVGLAVIKQHLMRKRNLQ